MVTVMIIAGSVLLAFILIASFEKHEEHKLSPAEEQQYELYPTISPEAAAITADNVKDIINYSIAEGKDHPLLAARKNG